MYFQHFGGSCATVLHHFDLPDLSKCSLLKTKRSMFAKIWQACAETVFKALWMVSLGSSTQSGVPISLMMLVCARGGGRGGASIISTIGVSFWISWGAEAFIIPQNHKTVARTSLLQKLLMIWRIISTMEFCLGF